MADTQSPKPEKELGELDLAAAEIGAEKSGEALEVKAPKKEALTEDTNLHQQIEQIDFGNGPKTNSAGANINVAAQAETINTLLAIAKKKGVVEAVTAAKKLNDPYALDAFHDALAKDGLYKKFVK